MLKTAGNTAFPGIGIPGISSAKEILKNPSSLNPGSR
jgi:hypothetical protein